MTRVTRYEICSTSGEPVESTILIGFVAPSVRCKRPADDEQDLVRLATWNLWWKFGPWEARQLPIATELDAVDADVVCLQEVWADDEHDQAETLAASSGRHMARTRNEEGAAHAFGNAVLSRWPILHHHTIVLPGRDGEPSHRSALFCEIEVPGAVHPWWIVSTHLEWRYSASEHRQMQLETIVAECARVRSLAPDTIVVIGADFNAVAESDELRRLSGLSKPYGGSLIFTDAWDAVSDEPGHTWSRANPHSSNAQWPRRRLDAVFVSWPRPKPTGNPIAAELFGLSALPTGIDDATMVPSDHYGVVVELDRRTAADLERS